MPRAIIVLVCCALAESDKIAQAIVDEGLAACVNVLPPHQSIYRWQGKICNETEQLLVIKSDLSVWDKLKDRVKQLHSYEVPEIVYFMLDGGDRPYLDWLSAAVDQGVRTDA